jgi:hypothetical protein
MSHTLAKSMLVGFLIYVEKRVKIVQHMTMQISVYIIAPCTAQVTMSSIGDSPVVQSMCPTIHSLTAHRTCLFESSPGNLVFAHCAL